MSDTAELQCLLRIAQSVATDPRHRSTLERAEIAIAELEAALQRSEAALAITRSHANELSMALGESVKLQSHYAGLLNELDGGQRIQFADATAWLERLRVLAQPKQEVGHE